MKSEKIKGVVLVNQSSGYLMIDIVNAYVSHYEKVVLMAGEIEGKERKLDSKVEISKIAYYNRKSSMTKLISWMKGYFQILVKLLLKYRNYDIVYVTNPPISYFGVGLLKNHFTIIVYDIYPEALKNIGVDENSIIYKYWEKKNRKIFIKADSIITLSNGMADALSAYIDQAKIKVIHNWPASESYKPISKTNNSFVKNLRLGDKFIVMYSGNIGSTHNVETLVHVARCLRDEETIHFLVIGNGGKKVSLIKEADSYKLTNITFLDRQPTEKLPYSLAAADLGVVTINEKTALLSVPSKTYNLMAVGAPLLCIAPENSELTSIVRKYDNGKCFSKSDIEGISHFVKAMASDASLRETYSANSIKASKDFSFTNALKYI